MYLTPNTSTFSVIRNAELFGDSAIKKALIPLLEIIVKSNPNYKIKLNGNPKRAKQLLKEWEQL